MKINIKDKINELGLKEIFCKVFAEKMNIDQAILEKKFDETIDRQINNIGRSLSQGKFNVSDNSKESLEEFMKKFDTVTKEE